MTRDEAIFAEAAELPFAERAAYLDQSCGSDAALRARIEALLDAHEAAAGFLEISQASRPPQRKDEEPGDIIGRYTLLRKLGEGGCGVVYLAEQNEPVRRQVALKVIKLGMDTHNVITRFEAERQALAMMDHPGIARVFDAGATATGRPFFVMEFVDGVPITKFADQHSLSMEARLELFARVCLALQHAHQKGIIHRDLKPSNILVSLQDGVPAPKVIDFGIAKATEGRLTEFTLFTAVDQFMGTPAYMSPEQAELRELDIDTRSDVYALGVLLYELLAGRPPFDPKSLVQAGINEIRRIIREVEPARPSTHVQTLTDADRTTVARLRGTAPAHLTTALRGDLDWIVMRCLEKDRARRYGTAQELAADVRRHLQCEPVNARPPQTLYRVGKFIARHRFACASATVVVLSLIAGTVVSLRQASRAAQAERVARAERDAATAAARAEALARADALRRQEQVENIFAFMLGDLRADLQKVGQLGLLDAVGAKAMTYFAALELRDLTDTALARQARALTQIGEIRLVQGRYADASAAFAAASDRAAALSDRHPQNGDLQFDRVQADYSKAGALILLGQRPAAGEVLAHAQSAGDALVKLDPKNRQWLSTRANLQLAALSLSARDEARQAMLDAARLRLAELVAAEPAERVFAERLARAWRLEARWRLAAGRTDAAAAITPAIELGEAQLKDPRADDRTRGELAESLVLAGRIAGAAGDSELARRHWLRVLDLLGGRLAESRDGRLLDPAARALVLVNRVAEGRALIEQLTSLGYHPLEAWPEEPRIPWSGSR